MLDIIQNAILRIDGLQLSLDEKNFKAFSVEYPIVLSELQKLKKTKITQANSQLFDVLLEKISNVQESLNTQGSELVSDMKRLSVDGRKLSVYLDNA